MFSATTRRQFLHTALQAISAVTLTAVTGEIHQPDYPNPERTAQIEEYAHLVEQTLLKLTQLHHILQQARTLPPEQVNAEQYLNLEGEAINSMEKLVLTLEEPESERFFEQLTGQRASHVLIKQDIRQGKRNPYYWQTEINAIAQDNPPMAAQLQALLDTHLQGRA